MADATSTPSGLPEEVVPTIEFPEVIPKEEKPIIEKPIDIKPIEKVNLPVITIDTKLSFDKIKPELSFVSFEAEQEVYKTDNGKYKQKLREATGDIETEVHEYKCPNGEVGYQVFTYMTKDTKQYVKSFGKGQEKSARDFDWVETNEDLI